MTKDEEISRTSAGKCLFCQLGDDSEKREVVRVKITRQEPTLDRFGASQQRRTYVNYECGLGELGKDCTLPVVYQIAYDGNQVGVSGDRAAQRF